MKPLGGTAIAPAALAALLSLGPSAALRGEPAGVEPAAAEAGTAAGLFVEAAALSGLVFEHDNGMDGRWIMAEIMGAGAALFDYNGDGDLDAYLIQGGRFGGEAGVVGRPSDRLFQNVTGEGPGAPRLGAGRVVVPRFEDVTARSLLGGGDLEGADGYGMGVAVGDVDLDGHPDLYLANYGPNQLWRNRGDGTFEDVTRSAGVGDPRWSVSATFVDIDRDGDLDLYVANYVVAPLDNQITCKGFAGHRDYCGPQTYPPERDLVLRNRGDGTFEDVTDTFLGTEARGAGLGVVSADVDGDGWIDLYVANDLTANHLWLNRQGRSFADEALLAGCALSGDGLAEASMGVVAGDLDGDGDVDLFMTHHDQQTNTLYLNEGGGFFVDASLESGLGNPSWSFTGFGTALSDFDGDGELDLFVANGAVTVKTDQLGAGEAFPFHERNQVFLGTGGGRFRDATSTAGPALAASEVSRGTAWGDVNGDGRVDLLITNNHGPARLLLTRPRPGSADDDAWLGVRLLTAAAGGRDAQGAWGGLEGETAGGKPAPVRWQRFGSDGSYASAGDPRRVWTRAKGATGFRVRWEDGVEERFPLPPTGRYSTLVRGQGRPVTPAQVPPSTPR
ncbi:MAG: VCBS repeat-containing protein [Holophagales bacterium]|nr:VCBS repeat-containing protein [Holophagales bacterium]